MPDGASKTVGMPTIAAANSINTLHNPSVLIIGAGIGGITLALDLDEKRLTNWIIVDREDDVGGTWYVNRYPGCRCDVPAVAYSHSRFQNSQWTETHPDHIEIQRYWANIVKTQGLTNRLRLQHEYVKAEWDSSQLLYHVTLRDVANDREVHVDAQVVVSATGAFSEPRRIPLEGEEQFSGQVVHAARWPKELTNEAMHGKTVVVVGNGCSGVQIVGTLGLDPQINLVSLARSQQWLMPSTTGGMAAARNSAPVSEKLRSVRASWPILQKVHRLLMLAVLDSHFHWQYEKEGASTRKRMERDLSAWMIDRAPEHMKDKVVPTFPFMAKRFVYEDGYFAALNSDHCEAVYGRIAGLTHDGVTTDDGREIKADIVVLSTGYDADHIDVAVDGDSDSTSNYAGKADMTYYHAIALPGLPNFYTMLGNNFLVNHSSVTEVLEIQAAYITQIVEAMRDSKIPKLEVRRSAAEKYDKWIERELKRTTWGYVHNYWRKDGTGRIFTHYPGTILSMWWQNAWPVWADYKGGEKLAARARARKVAFVLALVVGALFGGRALRDRHVPQRVAQKLKLYATLLEHFAGEAKDKVLALVKKA